MDDKDKVDPATNFPTELSWPLGGDSDGFYFFGSNYRDSSILSAFGWNIRPDNSAATGGGFIGLDRIDSKFAESSTPATSGVCCGGGEPVVEARPATVNTHSVSSSSSEDVPEKSTASAGSAEKATPETASKVKKKGVKRVRQQRFAFMTKSEIDHLEDGYRWRKYGQKAVKNSPFPRSYYRCTNSKCTVKKRVERSCEDPSTVITTYEGQHCHQTVGFPRGGVMMINHNNNEAAFGRQLINPNSSSASQYFYNYPAAGVPAAGGVVGFPQEGTDPRIVQRHQISSEESTPQLLTDGLLGDIVQLHASWNIAP